MWCPISKICKINEIILVQKYPKMKRFLIKTTLWNLHVGKIRRTNKNEEYIKKYTHYL